MNNLCAQETAERLAHDGFAALRHRVAPANDGGLSLGQLTVGAPTMGA
jgi:hydrogenase maturation factor HypF (carbamoyltransferase family)